MGVGNIRPIRDIDNRQFVSRREFNALLREVQRVSRLSMQTPGRYYDMPGARVVQNFPDDLAKRWKISYSSSALLWTLTFEFVITTDIGSGNTNLLVSDVYQFDNTMVTPGQSNTVDFFYDLAQIDPPDNPDWRIADKAGGAPDVTGANAATLAAENAVVDPITHRYVRSTVRVVFNEDGTHTIVYRGSSGDPEHSVDYHLRGPTQDQLFLRYRESTRLLEFGPFMQTANSGTGGRAGFQQITLPAGPVSNEAINLHTGRNLIGNFITEVLEVDGVFATTLSSQITKTEIGRITTDASDRLVEIRNTAQSFLYPFGLTVDQTVVQSVNFGAETTVSKTMRFGRGGIMEIDTP